MTTKSNKESTLPLRLNCLVFGSDPARLFTVNIDGLKNAYELRAAIKHEQKPEYDNITADTLRLWSVDLTLDNNLNKNVQQAVEKGQPMQPLTKLNRIFTSQPKDDRLHIVVQPPQSEC